MAYATEKELAEFMNILADTFDRDNNTLLELVGTGNGSKSVFLLKHGGVLSDTLMLFYGSGEDDALSQPLTDTTDYTFDSDESKVTLTSSGITKLGNNNLYAKYFYNILEIPESRLTQALESAESEIWDKTKQKWVDVSVNSPIYGQAINEIHYGRGEFNLAYFSDNFPIPRITAIVSTDIDSSSTTITVDSTDGFPESGYIGIDSQKIYYSTKTSTSFVGVELSSDISSGTKVYPHIMEINDNNNDVPEWRVLTPEEDYIVNYPSGNFNLNKSSTNIPLFNEKSQIRLTYLYGNQSIPQTIKRLTLMLASKDLMHSAVRKSTTTGNDGFKPNLVDIDESWIKETITNLASLGSRNI